MYPTTALSMEEPMMDDPSQHGFGGMQMGSQNRTAIAVRIINKLLTKSEADYFVM